MEVITLRGTKGSDGEIHARNTYNGWETYIYLSINLEVSLWKKNLKGLKFLPLN